MVRTSRIVSMAAASALAVSLSPLSPASAASCMSHPEVRAQIAAMRTDMVGAVKSAHARSATADAVHDVITTFRGAQATTTAERNSLGSQISAALKEMHATRNSVEKKALGLEIKALREQRDPGRMTATERSNMLAAFAQLRSTVLGKASPGAEVRQLQQDFRTMRSQITC